MVRRKRLPSPEVVRRRRRSPSPEVVQRRRQSPVAGGGAE
jgi:hypothetical protein